MARTFTVTFDAGDPKALGDFWQLALDYVREPPPDGYATWDEQLHAWNLPPEHWNDANASVDPTGTGPRLFFQKVPEGKTVKNRIHLDVHVGNRGPSEAKDIEAMHAHAKRLVEAGAAFIGEFHDPTGNRLLMHDPGGNEFCIV